MLMIQISKNVEACAVTELSSLEPTTVHSQLLCSFQGLMRVCAFMSVCPPCRGVIGIALQQLPFGPDSVSWRPFCFCA